MYSQSQLHEPSHHRGFGEELLWSPLLHSVIQCPAVTVLHHDVKVSILVVDESIAALHYMRVLQPPDNVGLLENVLVCFAGPLCSDPLHCVQRLALHMRHQQHLYCPNTTPACTSPCLQWRQRFIPILLSSHLTNKQASNKQANKQTMSRVSVEQLPTERLCGVLLPGQPPRPKDQKLCSRSTSLHHVFILI